MAGGGSLAAQGLAAERRRASPARSESKKLCARRRSSSIRSVGPLRRPISDCVYVLHRRSQSCSCVRASYRCSEMQQSSAARHTSTTHCCAFPRVCTCAQVRHGSTLVQLGGSACLSIERNKHLAWLTVFPAAAATSASEPLRAAAAARSGPPRCTAGIPSYSASGAIGSECKRSSSAARLRPLPWYARRMERHGVALGQWCSPRRLQTARGS